ncbi:hypothetical protein [Nostoc sp.]
MAIAHINHVRQSTLTEYILQNFKYSVTETIGTAYKSTLATISTGWRKSI